MTSTASVLDIVSTPPDGCTCIWWQPAGQSVENSRLQRVDALCVVHGDGSTIGTLDKLVRMLDDRAAAAYRTYGEICARFRTAYAAPADTRPPAAELAQINRDRIIAAARYTEAREAVTDARRLADLGS